MGGGDLREEKRIHSDAAAFASVPSQPDTAHHQPAEGAAAAWGVDREKPLMDGVVEALKDYIKKHRHISVAAQTSCAPPQSPSSPSGDRRHVTSFPRISLPISQLKTSYDVVVVGSGYGGSVAASRLARAGKSVCILELGKEVVPGEYVHSLEEVCQ